MVDGDVNDAGDLYDDAFSVLTAERKVVRNPQGDVYLTDSESSDEETDNKSNLTRAQRRAGGLVPIQEPPAPDYQNQMVLAVMPVGRPQRADQAPKGPQPNRVGEG